jgi:hypothetical protein
VSADLLEIAFNHDPDRATSDALSVRHDGQRPVAIPEWRRELGGTQASAACYARAETASGPIVIRARFARRQPGLQRIEVRTNPSALPDVPVVWPFAPTSPPFSLPYVMYWQQVALSLWFSGILPSGLPSGGNPLGNVEPTEVEFDGSGRSDFVTLRLSGTLAEVPVGIYETRWRWQCRTGSGAPWTDMTVSRHTIYVTLAAPTRPWVQAPNHPANVQLPWLNALDVACRWAAGARTADEAAERVTRAVYNLGPRLIEYDCLGPGVALLGSPHYTVIPGVFDCSAFLERLRGGIGNGRFVNCSDCAAIVATFANVLGCDLWQSKMGGLQPFPLNPTRSIGSRFWQSACTVGAFATHEVAWKGACLEDDELYDACLEIDGDTDPTRAPHTPLLPVGVPFGAAGADAYRRRLVAPPGLGLCQPLPTTRLRRIVV